jgi:hypothetical protein
VKYPLLQIRTKHQIPTNIELQTTGNKLQGKIVEFLVISEWSRVKNWNDVVFSRVKRLSGLFLMKLLLKDIDVLPASNYLEMMENLRKTILAAPEQVLELNAKTTLLTWYNNLPDIYDSGVWPFFIVEVVVIGRI